jgi:primosomal protein N' (replication factor Y)
MMPDIKLVEKINISEKMKKGHFTLIEEITSAIALGEQVILFQNRRGFSFSRMHDPGHVPHCQQCDLTYHKHKKSTALSLLGIPLLNLLIVIAVLV